MGTSDDRRSLRQMTRERILKEMLGTVRNGNLTSWRVLILDEVTVKVISKICKMGDIQEEGISVVEDLKKSRQPQRSLEAVYFVYPSKESVARFMKDMSGTTPLYKRAHVFFSSPLKHELLQLIKSSPSVLPRIAHLAELNLEFWIVDTQGFVTNHDLAMSQLMGGNESRPVYRSCIQSVATRLATVFASMKEFPSIRYRAETSSEANAFSGRDFAPSKLAKALHERLLNYKTIPDYPKSESCDLIIVTRAVDAVSPIIHEWTYDAMCHDLLDLDGNKFSYEVTSGSGKKEKKDILLEEHDLVWKELRDLHIADVSLRLNDKMDEFKVRNKAAKLKLGGSTRDDLSTKDMQKVVQALPQYQDELDKLSLHVHIATLLNEKIQEESLTDLSKVEQDLVFGTGTSKDLINILSTKQDLSTENKIRLLMIYAATYPEKCDGPKLQQWMKLARLTDEDMEPVNNMQHLGTNSGKKQHKITLRFGAKQTRPGSRKERELKEGEWQNARFFPVLQELLEVLAKDELSKDDYPFFRNPSQSSSDDSSAPTKSPVPSMRSRRTNWARGSQSSDDSQFSSDGSTTSIGNSGNHAKIKWGSRIFVFVIGGMTHSELRTAHKLSTQLRREVFIGSTSLDTPHKFITNVRSLSTEEELDIDI